MKLIISSLLLIQIFSLRVQADSNRVETESGETYYVFYSPEPKYYPVTYYYWTPAYIYNLYYKYTVYPVYYTTVNTLRTYKVIKVSKRTSAETYTESELPEAKLEDLQSELKALKKEIWNNESYSIEDLRKSGKIYDPRWLMAQMSLTRVIAIEDMIDAKSRNLKAPSRTEEVSGLNKLEESASKDIVAEKSREVNKKVDETPKKLGEQN